LFFNFLKRSADYFLTNQYNIEMHVFVKNSGSMLDG